MAQQCEKLTDDRRRTPSDGKSSRWQGEIIKKKLYIERSTQPTQPLNKRIKARSYDQNTFKHESVLLFEKNSQSEHHINK